MAEVPFWRHAVAFVLTMGEAGAAPWCVRWRAPGKRRSRILQVFDSRYAAERGLERYRAIEADEGPDGVRAEVAATRSWARRPFATVSGGRRTPPAESEPGTPAPDDPVA